MHEGISWCAPSWNLVLVLSSVVSSAVARSRGEADGESKKSYLEAKHGCHKKHVGQRDCEQVSQEVFVSASTARPHKQISLGIAGLGAKSKEEGIAGVENIP